MFPPGLRLITIIQSCSRPTWHRSGSKERGLLPTATIQHPRSSVLCPRGGGQLCPAAPRVQTMGRTNKPKVPLPEETAAAPPHVVCVAVGTRGPGSANPRCSSCPSQRGWGRALLPPACPALAMGTKLLCCMALVREMHLLQLAPEKQL